VQPRPRSESGEHPVVAWLAIAAILLSSALIFAAHVGLNGIEEMPSGSAGPSLHASLQGFATGFSTGFSQ
jgi:hypothetical protein